MKTKTTVGIFVTTTLLMVAPSIAKNLTGFEESFTSHGNFIVAHRTMGYEEGALCSFAVQGCSFMRTQVHETDEGARITIGTDSELKSYSCGELIYRQGHLGYGTYSIEMKASDIVGQVTSFFLIANEDIEIDIELTGLNNRIGWMNVWHDHKQNPVSIELPFDTSKDWHAYSFDWFKDHIVWYVDERMVLNRSDVLTTPPDRANYKLAVNSWTQVQTEINIDWAGKFKYPKDGRIPEARFRNMRFVPRFYNAEGKEEGTGGKNHRETAKPNAQSGAKLSMGPDGLLTVARVFVVAAGVALSSSSSLVL
ncbi:MAG: glycosyl hydrolases family 16-domain-containing protein [Benniella sp.]|nr:MAG: glycosyl hydrolases family 16-domain-containing protein [Benniella sp.]